MNTLPAHEIKRRGLAAIEEGLRHGPLHLIKRNRPVAVVLTEEEYLRLVQGRPSVTVPPSSQPITALEYLLALPPGQSAPADLRSRIEEERNSWDAS